MNSILFLSCLVWVKGFSTQIIEKNIDPAYPTTIQKDFEGFQFQADVFEDRLNSMEIKHQVSGVKNTVYTFQSTQRSLYSKLEIQNEEASLTCELKEKIRN